MNPGNALRSTVLVAALAIGRLQAQDVARPPIPLTPREIPQEPQQQQQPVPQPAQQLSQQPGQVPVQQPVLERSTATDTARYLAGMPVSEGSPLVALTRVARWLAHSRAMDASFSTLEQRQLSNIRTWRTAFLAPVTQVSHTCLYFFSGPDFLYADAFFPDCTTYVLVGLEPVELIPDLQSVPPVLLENTLQNIELTLNTLVNFSFFKTKDMREDLQRTQLKGVLPILFVFLARSGKEISNVDYISPGKAGARGVKVSFTDPATNSEKVLYYFSADLSDDGLKKNPAVLRFIDQLAPTNSFLKAASYLLHENGFNIARNYLLQVSALVLQDDSGIPIRYFAPEKWTLRFFGSYTGPINLFKNFYQPELRQYYQSSLPKALTFGIGYQWNRHNSTLILAVRK
ncbi:MAG: hypothetical protein WB586_14355 [Chthoniobacterales bacterium]